MPNKCSVTGCYTNYQDGPKKPIFKFPADSILSRKCAEFLNRRDFQITTNSVICIDHFEERFIIQYSTRSTLNHSMHPIPTIHPSFIPSNLATVPNKSRKTPTLRIYQSDELESFKSKFQLSSFADVIKYLKIAKEYSEFQIDVSDNSVTSYRVVIYSGIATVKEYIHIDSSFHIKLSYEGCPIPLPDYISCTEGYKLTSLDMLTNLPVYCRNSDSIYETKVIRELVRLQFYNPKGRTPYSSTVFRFALLMRYTSNSAYRYLKKFLPLPSYSLLSKLKSLSESIDTSKALLTLKENSLFSEDVILSLDEMYLQQEVQYDGLKLFGCDSELKMYKSILCFMVVSLKQSTPYILKAIPLTKINHHIVQDGILNCISMLNQHFNIRAVVCDNHSTNVSAYKHLTSLYPCLIRDNAMTNPSDPEKYTCLIFDTVHLIKNIRNNLLANRFFQVPFLEMSLMDVTIKTTPGTIQWSIFHHIHEKDTAIECHMRKAPKVTYNVLHPGNNKQSVPLALAIFDLTAIAAIRQYFPEDITASSFLSLVYNWWLLVNAKERFHPNIVGNALIAGDGKIEFLRQFSNWLSEWIEAGKLGLSKQTFDALINSNRGIADLGSDLLNEGYKYILTGRLQTDLLERRFSQYR